MTQKLWNLIGRILYWVTRPGIWAIVRLSPPRTRVVILRQGQVLLVKDWLGNGRWKLPGGGLHRGEDPEAGATRELKEEVHITLKPSQLKSIGKFNLRSSGVKVSLITYWVEVDKGVKASLSGVELAAAEWFDLEKLFGLNLTESTRAILEAFDDSHNLLK